MKLSLTISTLGHAMLLAWCLVSFSARPLEATSEALPVDVISSSEFSQITAGVKTAAKAEAPKPLVEKVAPDPKPVKDVTPKVSEKPEIETSQENTPPPAPQVKETPPKPEEKKPDEIAEALKKEPVKPPPMPPKKPPPPKLDMSKIENKLALLNKQEQRRPAAMGEVISTQQTLGSPTARAADLSASEKDMIRSRLMNCWNPPVGVADAKDLVVMVQFHLSQDGSLNGEPQVTNRSSSPLFQVAAESALRAVRRCAPFNFLPISKFEVWKDLDVKFDPVEMFRG
jgi:colicin import membrane protein